MEETEETGQLNGMWDPGLEQEQEQTRASVFLAQGTTGSVAGRGLAHRHAAQISSLVHVPQRERRQH